MGKNIRWDIKTVSVQAGVDADIERIEKALTDGWEPYAVTRNQVNLEYHFRRQI